ncbi:hypothetical protein BYT27DRAFT_6747932 [Phlegmacium glaucopus]|nr:hypothetical protein BYT27DRAFT_6747932 [Phlegmacium glaucopus]
MFGRPGKRGLVARAETMDFLDDREFTEWVEFIFGISQEEYKILDELSPLPSLQMVASTDETLMAPILKLFNPALTQLLTLVKKS